MPTEVSVVIPTVNGGETLGEMLESLAEQDFSGRWEVVVADNGSTDDTVAVAESYVNKLPELRVVDVSERRGRSYAINQAVDHVRGQKLLFVDDDDKVSPNYISEMVAALNKADLVGASLNTAALGPPWGGGDIAIEQGAIAAGFLPYTSGGCIGIRREVFDAVGGFDPNFRWGEDVDFSWRVLLADYTFHPVTSAVLYYRARSTLRGVFLQARSRGYTLPLLYRRYRFRGMPRRHAAELPRYYLGPLKPLLQARSKRDLALCAYLLGFRVGVLQGAVKYRTWYL